MRSILQHLLYSITIIIFLSNIQSETPKICVLKKPNIFLIKTLTYEANDTGAIFTDEKVQMLTEYFNISLTGSVSN